MQARVHAHVSVAAAPVELEPDRRALARQLRALCRQVPDSRFAVTCVDDVELAAVPENLAGIGSPPEVLSRLADDAVAVVIDRAYERPLVDAGYRGLTALQVGVVSEQLFGHAYPPRSNSCSSAAVPANVTAA